MQLFTGINGATPFPGPGGPFSFIILGEGGRAKSGGLLLQVSGLSTSSLVPKKTCAGSQDPGLAVNAPWVACSYRKDADGTLQTSATAITTDGIYYLLGGAALFRVDLTFVATGPLNLWWEPFEDAQFL